MDEINVFLEKLKITKEEITMAIDSARPVDSIENASYINHKDGNKLNNCVDNLEWCTNSYNVQHEWDSGNRTHKNNTAIKVYKDEELIGTYKSIRECARELHLDRHKIARVLKGELKSDYLSYTFSYA